MTRSLAAVLLRVLIEMATWMIASVGLLMEKECVIKQSPVCAPVTLMAISNKQETDGEGEGTEINGRVSDFKTGNHVMWYEFLKSKGPFWLLLLFSFFFFSCFNGLQFVNTGMEWKMYKNHNSIIKCDQSLFIQTNFPSCFHVTHGGLFNYTLFLHQ